MSKIIDEQYLIEQLLEKALSIGGDTPALHDIGEAKVFIKCILKCFDELGYKIIQEIEFFEKEDTDEKLNRLLFGNSICDRHNLYSRDNSGKKRTDY